MAVSKIMARTIEGQLCCMTANKAENMPCHCGEVDKEENDGLE